MFQVQGHLLTPYDALQAISISVEPMNRVLDNQHPCGHDSCLLTTCLLANTRATADAMVYLVVALTCYSTTAQMPVFLAVTSAAAETPKTAADAGAGAGVPVVLFVVVAAPNITLGPCHAGNVAST